MRISADVMVSSIIYWKKFTLQPSTWFSTLNYETVCFSTLNY
uniref:Uncharacterized protein n=1 Tax=Arundo donax TaxID=35708 RepID=A0A0A9HEJ0_ARUDO